MTPFCLSLGLLFCRRCWIHHLRRSFRAIATTDRMPTARPTRSEATRRCHSICSWNEVMRPSAGEAMPTMALAVYSRSMVMGSFMAGVAVSIGWRFGQ